METSRYHEMTRDTYPGAGTPSDIAAGGANGDGDPRHILIGMITMIASGFDRIAIQRKVIVGFLLEGPKKRRKLEKEKLNGRWDSGRGTEGPRDERRGSFRACPLDARLNRARHRLGICLYLRPSGVPSTSRASLIAQVSSASFMSKHVKANLHI